jgi:hypothetical protein
MPPPAALSLKAGRDEAMVPQTEQRDVAIDLKEPTPGPMTNLLNLTHATSGHPNLACHWHLPLTWMGSRSKSV